MIADRFGDLRSRCHGVSLGVFAADLGRLHEAASQVVSWGGQILHFDVMDGAFVPTLTGGPAFVKSLDVGLVRDVHLMVDRPSQHVGAFASAGADIITIHAEAADAAEAIAAVRSARARLNRPLMVGLGLMPETTLDAAEPLLALEPDVVVVLAVDPRKKAAPDIGGACKKITALAAASESGPLLVFDGGVTEATIEQVVSCKPDVVVSGSAIFGASSPEKMFRRFTEMYTGMNCLEVFENVGR